MELLVLATPSFSASSSSVPVNHVADTILRGVGVEPFTSEYIPSYQKSDMLTVTSNFMFAVVASEGSFLLDQFKGSAAVTGVSPSADFDDVVSPNGVSINNRISSTFGGQSMTVSVSGDKYYSNVACGHTSGNDFCMARNLVGRFAPLANSKSFPSGSESLVSVLDGFTMQENVITTPTQTRFDLSRPAHRAFYDELQYMYSTLTSLGDAQHSLYGLVKDPAPDSYSFVVSSFAQFAPESPEQASAMEILNAAISQFVVEARQAYPDALIEVATVATTNPIPSRQSRSLLSTTAPDPATNDDARRYQIVLWFSVGWTIVLFFACYAIAFPNVKKDSLLYGDFKLDN